MVNDVNTLFKERVKKNNMFSLVFFIMLHMVLFSLWTYFLHLMIIQMVKDPSPYQLLVISLTTLFLIPIYWVFAVYMNNEVEITREEIIIRGPKLFRIWEYSESRIWVCDVGYYVIEDNIIMLFDKRSIVIMRIIIPLVNRERERIANEIVQALEVLGIERKTMDGYYRTYGKRYGKKMADNSS